MVKIYFDLEPAWHNSSSESLWAQELGFDLYRLDNSPFFAFGISYCDVVSAQEVDGLLRFLRVVERGGHSTYRIIVNPSVSSERLARSWSRLELLGCTFEQGQGRLRSVDVPPSAEIDEVYQELESGVAEGVWDLEEGHSGQKAND
jgi:Domain of unknown function (DUF4265)